MRSVFADTLYWIASALPGDGWGSVARQARESLGSTVIVTTDEVLAEFLTALSRNGEPLRRQAAKMVRAILRDPNVRTVPQSRDSFLRGLGLYEERPDKEYSLTDCISMCVMRSEGLTDVLTSDHHFGQEKFRVLMRHD